MNPEHLEVLSALFDGERVDPSLLAEALANHDAAVILADFAGLRVLARADAPEPSDAFYVRMAPLLKRAGLRDRVARFIRPAVAAAVMLAAGAAGFILRPVIGGPPTAVTPPLVQPLRPPAAVATVAPPPAAVAVGPETRVRRDTDAPPASALRLRFTHWQETGAGSGHSPE
jgi:hypothetical protein